MKHNCFRHIVYILLAFVVATSQAFAQTKKQTQTRKTNRTAQAKSVKKKAKAGTAKSKKSQAADGKSKKDATVTYSNASIKKLQSQRADIRKKIKEQERKAN